MFTRRDSEQLPDEVTWAPGVRVINLGAGPARFIKKDPMWSYMPRFRDAFLRYARQRPEGEQYGLIHAHFWMSGWVACQVKSLLDVPVVETFHALGRVKRIHQGAADTSPEDRIAVEHGIMDQVDSILAECPNDLDDMVSLYGADPSKIRVVPAGVNTETFRPIPRRRAREAVGLDPDEWIAAYVGRMVPRKGIDNLIQGFAQVARRAAEPVRLVIVGGETVDPDPMATPEIRRLSGLATELGIRHLVHFTGKRPQEELKFFYSAANVAVTTPWYEPFGFTPLEAMACGTPVIGSDVGGIKFTVMDEATGFLVPPKEPAALAEKLETLLADKSLGERMGRTARSRVELLFTWPRIAEQVARLYETVIEAHARRGQVEAGTSSVERGVAMAAHTGPEAPGGD